MQNKEVWKQIKGLEGKYEISNLGRVKSVARIEIRKDGRKRPVKEKIRKSTVFNNGYYGVSTNRLAGTFLIHRLIAEAFIPNPESKQTVNHKNGIKTDNRIENLEWATYGENNKHAYEKGLKKYTSKMRSNAKNLMTKNRKDSSKLVLNTNTGIFYNSIKEAAISIEMNCNTLQGKLLGRSKNNTYFIYA